MVVEAQAALPMAAVWGHGADRLERRPVLPGRRCRGEALNLVNARYGTDGPARPRAVRRHGGFTDHVFAACSIEHRLFCHITANWRGTPLTTYETIVDRIGNVRTATGLRVRAELDAGEYPTGVTVTKEQMDALALVPDAFHGEWNYKLLPR